LPTAYNHIEKDVSLQFSSIVNLIDFELGIEVPIKYINRSHLTVTGNFNEAEIEFAKTAYGAKLIDSI